MKEYDRNAVGERLREIRKEKGLGQNQLAKQLMLSNASISYWENGKQDISASALFKLSKFFSVSSDYILGLEE